jgi:hypothetical protein
VKLTLIEGPAITLVCTVCGTTGIGGTYAYLSASSGESRVPVFWYQEGPDTPPYCSDCAAKISQQDDSRSVNQFFSDVEGAEIARSVFDQDQ